MNAQQLEWDDIRYILAVCKEGSLSAAARTLSVNHSTVFRRIGGIEEKLGVRLFDRLTTGYAMTNAGEIVLNSATHIEEEIHKLARQLHGGDYRLSGMLRITVPEDLSTGYLLPLLASFHQRYPDIQTEILASNEVYNLSQHEADIAIRSTSSPQETLVGQRLCTLRYAPYASIEYLQKNPDKTLANHKWLSYSETFNACPAVKWLARKYPQAPIVFRSTSVLSLFEAAKNHMGVAILPGFLADPEAILQPVCEPPDELTKDIWVLTHPDLRRTAKVHAFMKFIREIYSAE
ncbi:MAG: LysR family transcriptional regulator [Gammaproteobacteria bacterium]